MGGQTSSNLELINDEYYKIYAARDAGIDTNWWNTTVNRLWDWKAIRARNPPNTKEQIRIIGLRVLREIEIQCQTIRRQSSGEPTIEELSWDTISPLFELALEMKNGSPVFACKMCHFLFPKAFLVIDNWATGIMDYEFCWRGMKDEWSRFPAKDKARLELRNSIRSKEQTHPLYPFETKIMEFCLTGNYWRDHAIDERPGEPLDILRVGGEGGDIVLLGEYLNDRWRFRLETNESSLWPLEEDQVRPLPTAQDYFWVHSWPAALALLDRYPWAELIPQAVHSEFRDPVWREVNRRRDSLRDDDSRTVLLSEWTRLCAAGEEAV